MIIWRRPPIQQKKSIVTIGNFDGIHLGHQALLQKTMEIATARNASACLLMFEPYPQAFFHPEKNLPRLTTLREKIFIVSSLNIDVVYILPFNKQFSRYSPQEFIDKILREQLNTAAVVVGEDFRFAYQREGDVATLQAVKQFTTHIVSPLKINDLKVSSTRVRENLQKGDLVGVKQLLGHDYFMIGRVVQGDKRGRKLGFPTANIALKNRQPPLRGVYAVRVYGIAPQAITGVANIGTRPTVDGVHTYLEVHLFDFSQEIYGKYLRVEFMTKIREEQRFASLDALTEQIAKDVVIARECFR